MNILLISDIHNRIDWIRPCLTDLKGKYDKVVFLGDYFDSWNDTDFINMKTASWLHDMLNTDEFGEMVFCLGNHDCYYSNPICPDIRSSGNTPEKARAINTKMKRSDWNKFKLFHYEKTSKGKEWYFSHAGLSEYHFCHTIHGITKNIIEKLCSEALEDLKIGKVNSIFGVGMVRHGWYPVGGITWQDWRYEFNPIKGFNQIVGHTIREKPEKKKSINSENWCIDTNNKYICWWKDGKVTYEENKWIK